MSPEIQTFFLSMTPIGELRIALPVALLVYNLSLAKAFLISVLGNTIIIAFILLLLDPVSDWLSRNFKIFRVFFNWLFERTRKKHGPFIEKYGDMALIFFVAIPLPFTGAWTGSLLAFIFGIPFKRAFPLVIVGILLAGVIISTLVFTGINIEKYFGWQALVGILFVIFLGRLIINIKRK